MSADPREVTEDDFRPASISFVEHKEPSLPQHASLQPVKLESPAPKGSHLQGQHRAEDRPWSTQHCPGILADGLGKLSRCLKGSDSSPGDYSDTPTWQG